MITKNTILVDIQFVPLLSGRFRNFKRKKDYLWNFSCPLCGDSKKKTTKARGYIYRGPDSLCFKCWNCGEASRFSTFLKKIDDSLHKEYLMEVLKSDSFKPQEIPMPVMEKPDFKNKINLTKASMLSP